MEEESCIYLITQAYESLSVKEKMIADFILKKPHDAVHPTIDELADIIGISEPTLVRFVRKLGYSGYQRFRIALAREATKPEENVYETALNLENDELDLIFNCAISTLEKTKAFINRASILSASDLIFKAEKVLFFGLGGSYIVAQDAFHKFVRTGINCLTAEDFHLQLMLASQVNERCVAIIFSHTGTNRDALSLVQEIKITGCPIIAITSYPRSPLASAATISIAVKVSGAPIIYEAFSARLAHLVVIDTLYVELMKRLSGKGFEHLDAMRKAIAKRRI